LPIGEAVTIHTAYEARIDYEERKIRKRLHELAKQHPGQGYRRVTRPLRSAWIQRIVQQPDESGVYRPRSFRFALGSQGSGCGIPAVLESGAVAQRDRVPDAGGIRIRTCVGPRFAPSDPSSINTTNDSHKHWQIKWDQVSTLWPSRALVSC